MFSCCTVTNEEFLHFFEQFGQVTDSVVMYDRESLRSRGFGFVTFEDPEIASHLLTMGSETTSNDDETPRSGRLAMREKMIEIKAAEPKEHCHRIRNHPRSADNRRAAPVDDNTCVMPADPIMMMYGMSNYPVAPYCPPYYPPVGSHFAGYVAPMYYPNFDEVPVYSPMVGAYPHPSPVDAPMPGGYAFIPFMPASTMPSVGQQGSVMQHVAPGIPGKDDEGAGGDYCA
jgi:RNA recognition motif. (a.k.a. RRM, RBD, or RNP domain)